MNKSRKDKKEKIFKREMFARYRQIWASHYPNVEIKLYKKRVVWILRDHFNVIKCSEEITPETLRYFMDMLEKDFTKTAIYFFCTLK